MAQPRTHVVLYYPEAGEPDFEAFVMKESEVEDFATLLIDAFHDCRIHITPASGKKAVEKVAREHIASGIADGTVEQVTP